MHSEPANYKDNNFLLELELRKDLERLQVLCKYSDEEGWELFDKSTMERTIEFFKSYNQCFSFYLLQKLKCLYSQTELDFKPYLSNLKEFRLRGIEELYSFQRPSELEVFINKTDTLDLVWEKFGSDTYYQFEIQGRMNIDLKKSIEYIRQKKQSPMDDVENLENLKKNLILLLGFYNAWIKFFLESLAARETFIHIYNESNNFSFFQKEILKNILSLDQVNDILATQLLTFRKEYAEICSMVTKAE